MFSLYFQAADRITRRGKAGIEKLSVQTECPKLKYITHIHGAEDAAAGQPGQAVLDGRHGEAVLLGDIVEPPPVHAPPDAAVLLPGRDQVEAPGRVGRFDHPVFQPVSYTHLTLPTTPYV